MAHPHTENPHVLVIEDNAFQRQVAVNTLRSIGVTRITDIASAEQALNLFRDESVQFDATLCDLRLEGMDGLEFLKSAPAHRLGTVILTSALSPDIYQSSARVLHKSGLRIAGCMPKPIEAVLLKQMLAGAAPQPSAGRGQAVQALFEPITFSRQEMLDGLHSNHLVAYFQPKVELASGQFAGAETLARWKHPTLGILQPAQFLDQIDKHGLIDELTDQVLEQACQLIASWPKDLPALRLSVNISAESLQDDSAQRRWRDIVERYLVSPAQITLELTETSFLSNDLALLEGLTRLRIAGFGVSLDDFGTGYTSLKQLRTLPVTELKVDRSFIQDASTLSRPAIILDSIINVAKRLRIIAVAEGVETQSDASYLAALGCQIGQGYFFARPLPADQLLTWVRTREASGAHLGVSRGGTPPSA